MLVSIPDPLKITQVRVGHTTMDQQSGYLVSNQAWEGDEEDGNEGWHEIWIAWAQGSKDLLACSWLIWCGFVT